MIKKYNLLLSVGLLLSMATFFSSAMEHEQETPLTLEFWKMKEVNVPKSPISDLKQFKIEDNGIATEGSDAPRGIANKAILEINTAKNQAWLIVMNKKDKRDVATKRKIGIVFPTANVISTLKNEISKNNQDSKKNLLPRTFFPDAVVAPTILQGLAKYNEYVYFDITKINIVSESSNPLLYAGIIIAGIVGIWFIWKKCR